MQCLDTTGLSLETANVQRGISLRSAATTVSGLRLQRPATERIRLQLASTMDSVAQVEEQAESFVQSLGVDEDLIFPLVMGIREAAVNAVLHGNSYDPQKCIVVTLEHASHSLIVTIADQGDGFNPETLPDPREEENLLRGTGRGIFLIRSFFDEVEFRQLHPGTEIRLVKKLADGQSG